MEYTLLEWGKYQCVCTIVHKSGVSCKTSTSTIELNYKTDITVAFLSKIFRSQLQCTLTWHATSVLEKRSPQDWTAIPRCLSTSRRAHIDRSSKNQLRHFLLVHEPLSTCTIREWFYIVWHTTCRILYTLSNENHEGGLDKSITPCTKPQDNCKPIPSAHYIGLFDCTNARNPIMRPFPTLKYINGFCLLSRCDICNEDHFKTFFSHSLYTDFMPLRFKSRVILMCQWYIPSTWKHYIWYF